MIEQLQQDLVSAPGAFDLAGPTDRDLVERLVADRGCTVFAQLRELWVATGGGDMFETEEVLGPIAEPPRNLDIRNAELRRAGMPADVVAFHVGLYVTAINAAGAIVALDPHTYVVTRAFRTLGEWYADLRGEYARAYGLAAHGAT